MAFTINLYKFDKKVNSTKLPSGAESKSLSCNIKTQSSIINPVVEVKDNPIGFNYAYIERFNRYYFINNISYGIGLWILELSVDVLASFRSNILNSRQYILRSASEYDGRIVDEYYPTIANVTYDISYLNDQVRMGGDTLIDSYFSRKMNTGAFVFGVIGDNVSGVTYYETGYTGLKQLIGALSSYFPSDMSDVSNGIAKQLADPMQYITTVFWYPYAPVDAGSGYVNIKFGDYTININAIALPENDYVKYFTTSVQVPKHPKANARGKYLNLSPYSQYILDFKPFGYFNLDTTLLNECDELAIRWYIDFTTGEATLGVYKNNDYSLKLLNSDCLYGIPIRLSEISIDYIGAIGSYMGLIGSVATANIGGIFQSIGSAAKSLIPQPSTKGTTGSFIQQFIAPCIYASFNDIVDTDDEHIGRPLCSMRLLNNLTGYVQCGNSVIQIDNAMNNEKEQIESYLNEGFFIE